MAIVLGAFGWNGVLQVLAVAGGLVAVATFAASRLDGQREQASAVYLIQRNWTMDMDEPDAAKVTVALHNDSDLPVLDIAVASWNFGSRRRLWRLHASNDWCGPWRRAKRSQRRGDELLSGSWLGSSSRANLQPRSTTADAVLRAPHTRPAAREDENLRPPVTLAFRDANGRRWVRWHDGKLSRRWPSRA